MISTKTFQGNFTHFMYLSTFSYSNYVFLKYKMDGNLLSNIHKSLF